MIQVTVIESKIIIYGTGPAACQMLASRQWIHHQGWVEQVITLRRNEDMMIMYFPQLTDYLKSQWKFLDDVSTLVVDSVLGCIRAHHHYNTNKEKPILN